MRKQAKSDKPARAVKQYKVFGYDLTASELAKVEQERKALVKEYAAGIAGEHSGGDKGIQDEIELYVSNAVTDFERYLVSGVWRDRVAVGLAAVGVKLSKNEAKRMVRRFRDTAPELERAVKQYENRVRGKK